MPELVADCPRCGAKKIAFDVTAYHHVGKQHNWQSWFEAFSLCRNCNRTTLFVLSQQRCADGDPLSHSGIVQVASLNNFYTVEGYISLKDFHHAQPPDHVPTAIKAVFDEGATCLAVECFNAAGTMFRLCVDMATRNLLPQQDTNGLNAAIRRSLGLRIPWLLDNKLLPETLRELSTCIQQDGNDGAHAGTLQKAEAEDLLDFTTALLERLFTEPERLRLAKQRRDARRAKS
jgi:hypothetical protein